MFVHAAAKRAAGTHFLVGSGTTVGRLRSCDGRRVNDGGITVVFAVGVGTVGGEDNAEEDEGSHRSVLISLKRVGLLLFPLDDAAGVFEDDAVAAVYLVVIELTTLEVLVFAEFVAAAALRLSAAIPEAVVVVVFEALEVEVEAF
ncbi:hypothetical protein FS842_004271 [Serendipita sp. 407]|nr:hypothetical protein FS842_004271 [Serendipita sp. 407]